MGFIKDRTIYQRGDVLVYINECHAPGRKTRLFAIRKDDQMGKGHYIGSIEYSTRWRRYVFAPDIDTMWDASCLEDIASFLDEMNRKQQEKLRRQRKRP